MLLVYKEFAGNRFEHGSDGKLCSISWDEGFAIEPIFEHWDPYTKKWERQVEEVDHDNGGGNKEVQTERVLREEQQFFPNDKQTGSAEIGRFEKTNWCQTNSGQ